ncbi:ABC transporter ATP-binding protein [Microbulbifer thermotolerans]|uniref:ABC transporter ATP-binding protein n=1 Tax=Microbulbifer thermotolerans TaxID=252514 RepID=UPI00224907F3|nr:ABC transporter ATP-binding protein [Microbulbifer thermotolerans]MCX2794387.1 ABC transporter ATP-binding protein [Microbulbifer thermotolerans]
MKDPLTSAADAITVQQLRFSYSDGDPVLDIPHWSVPSGGRVFLRGPSGCGKSTLLKILAGILVAPAERLELLGQPMSALTGRQRDRFRARHIGVVFQQFNLIPYLSVLDNIRLAAYFGNSARNLGQRAGELLARLRLREDVLSRRVTALSVGQQQRVAIARALINGPQVLLVDEPTSAMDIAARDAFIQLLMEICERDQCTLIFVSHDSALAAHFPLVMDMCTLNRAWNVRSPLTTQREAAADVY